MLRLPTHSSAAVSRASLLMQYLRAIGPGTVIVKAGPTGSRNDSTGCELLRYHLWQWAFLPQPDAHFPLRNTCNAEPLHEAMTEIKQYKTFGGTKPNPDLIEKFRLWKTTSIPMIMRWQESSEIFNKKTNDWNDWLNRKVTIPEAGPIVIIGSPEGYLSYENSDSLRNSQAPLRQILTESGYCAKFKMLLPHNGGGLQLATETKTVAEKEGYQTDLSLIFMGRANNGRTIVVLAGSTNTFGTFSAIRVATDYGRNEVNSMVLDFINQHGRSHASVVFSSERFVSSEINKPLRISDPINITFIENLNQYSSKRDIDYRRLEVELNQLDPTPLIPKSQQTTLAKYLSEQGLIGIVTKWYPQDLRDDATAMDILEFALEDSVNYPVPPSPPIPNIDDEEQFSKAIKTFVSSKPKSDGTDCNDTDDIIAKSLMLLDDECFQLFKLWQEAHNKLTTSDDEFANWFDSQFQTPTDGPVVIIGTPSSFMGSGSQGNERKTNLCKILSQAGFPNRYILNNTGIHGIIQGEIFDRKTCTTRYKTTFLGECKSGYEEDAGIISLSKGPDGRDVLIIAGVTWLGTLAGVRLLFTQQRPTIDKCISDYSSGLRKRIDIFFTCKTPRVSLPNEKKTPDSNQWIWPTHQVFEEISIDTHGSEREPEFVHNEFAEACFFDLFSKIKKREVGSVTISSWEKDFFELHLSNPSDNEFELSMVCMSTITIDGSKIVCGKKLFDLYNTIDRCLEDDFLSLNKEFFIVEHSDGGKKKHTVNSMRSACKPFCGKFFILGESGVGKENVSRYVKDRIKVRLNYDIEPFVLNTACIPETLLQSEIFGSVRGAFTDGPGRMSPFEKSIGGVFFLDEFAALDGSSSLSLQANLLRVMENCSFSRVGAIDNIKINCVLVAATNRASNLEELQLLFDSKVIRSDIGNRFEGRLFSFPPLRERPLEILPAFILKLRSIYQKNNRIPPEIFISVKALELLLHFNFPGNFRQLDGIAKGIVRLIDEKRTKTEIRISLDHMYYCLFLGEFHDKNLIEGRADWVKISIGFSNPSSGITWQANKCPSRTSIRPAFIDRDLSTVLKVFCPTTRFVDPRDRTVSDNAFITKNFMHFLGGNRLDLLSEVAVGNFFHTCKGWFSGLLSSSNQKSTPGKSTDYSQMPGFAACISLMSKASESAYLNYFHAIDIESIPLDDRKEFASIVLSEFLRKDAFFQGIDWEIFVTFVFLYTGFDIRTSEEIAWMDWVASQRGHIRTVS